MKRRTLLGSMVTATTPLVAGCSDEETEVPTTTVTAKQNAFDPVRVSIDTGTRIRWKNEDSHVHAVKAETFTDGATEWSFNETVNQDESITHTFEDSGVYQYKDRFFGEGLMCGAILVGDVSLDGALPCE